MIGRSWGNLNVTQIPFSSGVLLSPNRTDNIPISDGVVHHNSGNNPRTGGAAAAEWLQLTNPGGYVLYVTSPLHQADPFSSSLSPARTQSPLVVDVTT